MTAIYAARFAYYHAARAATLYHHLATTHGILLYSLLGLAYSPTTLGGRLNIRRAPDGQPSATRHTNACGYRQRVRIRPISRCGAYAHCHRTFCLCRRGCYHHLPATNFCPYITEDVEGRRLHLQRTRRVPPTIPPPPVAAPSAFYRRISSVQCGRWEDTILPRRRPVTRITASLHLHGTPPLPPSLFAPSHLTSFSPLMGCTIPGHSLAGICLHLDVRTGGRKGTV